MNLVYLKKDIALRLGILLSEGAIPILDECENDNGFLSDKWVEDKLDIIEYNLNFIRGLIEDGKGEDE